MVGGVGGVGGGQSSWTPPSLLQPPWPQLRNNILKMSMPEAIHKQTNQEKRNVKHWNKIRQNKQILQTSLNILRELFPLSSGRGGLWACSRRLFLRRQHRSHNIKKQQSTRRPRQLKHSGTESRETWG